MLGQLTVGVAPETTLVTLGFAVAGIGLGTVSGLVPGLHANNFALVLASVAPAVPAAPLQLGTAMLAAGVVHTFLDVVPTLAIGVPDPSMAATVLPAHQLVRDGRGREALRLSALGSALAVALAVPLAVPVTVGMRRAYPAIAANLSLVLGSVCVLVVVTEPTWRSRAGAAVAVAASGALGVLTLDLSTDGVLPAGDMLTPLFAGLFGAPILIEAAGGAGVPPQDEPAVWLSPRQVVTTAGAGTLAGAVVGYLPGISAAIAAAAALVALPNGGARAFVVASSGVSTANTVFALFALVALGSPRTGVLVAVEETGVPHNLPVLLASVAIAAAAGFVLVVVVGDRYLAVVGALDTTAVCLGVLCFLGLLVAAFTGVLGLAVFAGSTVIGLVPGRLGARRMSCMGVLLIPLIL